MKTLSLVGCLVALAASGCYVNFDDGRRDGRDDGWDEGGWDTPAPTPAPPPPDGWGGYESGVLDVREASLAGEMGSVILPGGVYEVAGSSYGTSLSVTMYARGRGGEAMGMLTLDGYGTAIALEPGMRFDSRDTSYGYGAPPEGAVFISALGCSGEDRGAWIFDQSPEQTTVEVRAGAGANERQLDYTMRFSDGNVVTGSFTVPVDPTTGAVDSRPY